MAAAGEVTERLEARTVWQNFFQWRTSRVIFFLDFA